MAVLETNVRGVLSLPLREPVEVPRYVHRLSASTQGEAAAVLQRAQGVLSEPDGEPCTTPAASKRMADRAIGILPETSVVVAHLRGRIDIRARTAAGEPLFLPLVALGELDKGAEKSARPADNLKLVDDFLQMAALLDPETATAESYARAAVALEA